MNLIDLEGECLMEIVNQRILENYICGVIFWAVIVDSKIINSIKVAGSVICNRNHVYLNLIFFFH